MCIGLNCLATVAFGKLVPPPNWRQLHFSDIVDNNAVIDQARIVDFVERHVTYQHILHRVDASSLRPSHGTLPTRAPVVTAHPASNVINSGGGDDAAFTAPPRNEMPGPRSVAPTDHERYTNDFERHYDNRVRVCVCIGM